LTQFSNYSEEIKKGILIRCVEEKLLELFKDGHLNGTVHTCVGQELIGVFISKYLNENDHIVSNHRGHGHYLARFGDIKGLIAEVMGKVDGCSGGNGGSQHMVNKNYLSNGIQGGMVPIATGIGLYYRKKGIDAISVAYIGDGTLGEGIIYESFNIASNWGIPLLVVLENNQYAQSTSIKQSFSGNIPKRVQGFGLKYFSTSSNNIEDLDTKTKDAVEYVRKNNLPAFIEISTNRLNAHSKGDDNRSSEDIKSYCDEDIINKVISNNSNGFSTYKEQIISDINAIVSELMASEDLLDIKNNEFSNSINGQKSYSPEIVDHARYNELVNKALYNFLEINEDAIIIGEDIEANNQFTPNDYGGAFKVTKSLSTQFPDRVLNTPISEAAIVGVCAGFSIKAGRSIVEIMFGDFTTLIFDQLLQHVSKFELMYNGKVKCPLIIRTPMGGKRGYGPTHSQSLEKYFIGIPNLGVVALHHRISPVYIYNVISKNISTPFLIIENKVLYTLDTNIKKIEGYEYSFSDKLFPSLMITAKFDEPKITVTCYGEVLYELELAIRELFIEEEIIVDIVVPSLISPIDYAEIADSVKKTKNLVIIEEGSGIASWGSELVSRLNEDSIVIEKLTRFSNNNIIPSALRVELKKLPTKDNIKELIKSI
jgi:2-oxoisovalerate dehydrogenase E1 component